MTSVGSVLRSAREQQNKSIAEIAEELCITQRYLRALEEDDLANLPGAFFYRSFVRQYAALLRIDIKSIQSGVDELSGGSTPAREEQPVLRQEAPTSQLQLRSWLQDSISLQQPPATNTNKSVREPEPLVQDVNRSLSDRRIGVSVAGLAVALLVCSAFYSWWTKPVEPTVTITAQPSERQAVIAVANAPATLTVATKDANGITQSELDISATETTWLSITADGKVIFSGVLEPSQTKTLSGVEGAQMKVGNAGGLDIRWKGKPIGPIGPRGQVRTVLFKTDDVEILQPPVESSEL